MNHEDTIDSTEGASTSIEGAATRDRDPRSRGTLSEMEIQSIDLFVRLAHLLGIPKSVGEIYGFLFSSTVPVSFDEIVTKLSISKGSASIGLRHLRAIGAAKSTYVSGERRDYYLAEVELRKLVTGFLTEQVRPHLINGAERVALLTELAARESTAARREILAGRVRKLESWRATAAATMPAIVGMFGS
jgi:DNA-binding transcriptional regulator GbsR (MarR family)